MTGCPNGCARPFLGDIGFVGRTPGKYQIYVGGDFEGTHLNRLLADLVPVDEIPSGYARCSSLPRRARREGGLRRLLLPRWRRAAASRRARGRPADGGGSLASFSMAESGPLTSRTIALLEARRSAEIARLIERQGGTPYVTPILREVPVEDSAPLQEWLRRVARGELEVVIFLTGVGCRALLGGADQAGELDAVKGGLDGVRVVARGPKPVQVLKEYGVRVDYVPPEPNTSEELLAAFAEWQLGGRTVGLQVYGGTTPYLERLREGLRGMGAEVDEVAPYRWEGPTDDTAVRALIDDCLQGRVDALAIFSSSQIHNLFAIAEEHDVASALQHALSSGSVMIASVGPVATQAIRSHGLPVHIEPEHPKMGHVVMALAEAFRNASAAEKAPTDHS